MKGKPFESLVANATPGLHFTTAQLMTPSTMQRTADACRAWATTSIGDMVQECVAAGHPDIMPSLSLYSDQPLFNAIELLAATGDAYARLAVLSSPSFTEGESSESQANANCEAGCRYEGAHVIGFFDAFDVARIIVEDVDVMSRRLTNMRVLALMDEELLPPPCTLSKDDTVLQGFYTMFDLDEPCAAILDERGTLVADICTSDLCEVVAHWVVDGRPTEEQLPTDYGELLTPVLDYQCKVNHADAIVITAADSVIGTLERLLAARRGQAFLCDETGAPIAVFGLLEMLRLLLDESEMKWERTYHGGPTKSLPPK